MRFSARIFCVVFSLLFFFLSFASRSASAQDQPQPQAQALTNSFMRVDNSVPLNISTVTQGVFLGMLSSTTCVLGGIDFFSPNHRCLSYDAKSGNLAYSKEAGTGGILGVEAAGLTLVYTPPFHTSDYFQYLSRNFGLSRAYAADGIGFGQLNPIVNLWLAFRNLSYLLFVLAFVIIGFAIMLRAKIDPRTVMTIENQIPKLIVALILITFSFAIAGFVIDIMWVGIYLVINLFGNLDPQLKGQIGTMTAAAQSDPFSWVNTLNSGFGGFLGIAGQAASAIGSIAGVIAKGFFSGIGVFKYLFLNIVSLPTFLTCALGTFLNGALGINKDTLILGGLENFFTGGTLGNGDFSSCVDAGLSSIIGGVMTAVVFIIFSISLIVAIARLWWALIKAYSLFLIFTIFGPIMIMMGVIPGSKTNFEYWIRHLLALTIVFPTAMAIFLLGKTLMDVYQPISAAAPPLLGIDPRVSGFLGPLLGFTVVMLAPQALSLVEEGLGAPEPKFLAGIGQAIGVGSQAFGSAMGKGWDRSFRAADPLHNLDEGWIRKLVLPKNSTIRKIVIGKETGTGLQPNKGASGGHG